MNSNTIDKRMFSFTVVFKTTVCVLACVFTLNAQADEISDIIGATSTKEETKIILGQQSLGARLLAELKISGEASPAFANAVMSEDYTQALKEFPKNLQPLVKQSDDIKAFFAWILLRSKQPETAIEFLLKNVNAVKVSQSLNDQLKVELAKISISQFSFKWPEQWLAHLSGSNLYFASLENLPADPTVEQIEQVLLKSQSLNDREELLWTYASRLGQQDDVKKSAAIYKVLLSYKDAHVGQDLISLNIARLLYQKGYLDAALEYYEKVPTISEYWFLALEERAWTLLRLGKLNKVRAVLHEIDNKELLNLLTPESFVVGGIASLKQCDYPRTQNYILKFKALAKNQFSELQLIRDAAVQDFSSTIAKHEAYLKDNSKKKRATSSQTNHVLNHLVFARNFELEKRNQEYVVMLKELDQTTGDSVVIDDRSEIKSASAKATGLGKAETEAKAESEAPTVKSQDLKMLKQKRFATIQSKYKERFLAQVDLQIEAYESALRRMQVVDAELTQQLIKFKNIQAAYKGSEVEKTKISSRKFVSNQLTFKDDKEIWLDEINHYEVSESGMCHKLSGVR